MKRTVEDKGFNIFGIVMVTLCVIWAVEVGSAAILQHKAKTQLAEAKELLERVEGTLERAKDYRDEALKLHVESMFSIEEAMNAMGKERDFALLREVLQEVTND